MVVIHLFVSCILMIQPHILEIVLISDIQKNRECLILKFCDITPLQKKTPKQKTYQHQHTHFFIMFFSLSGQTQQYRHANDKRCSNLPQQECHAVQKLLISVKQHCHAIHQKKQNEIRQHSFFPFQITAAVTDHFFSQISTVKNHAV